MIRAAKESDFGQILILCREFWRHTIFNHEPFEDDHALEMVKMSLDHGLLAVLEINNEIVGFVMGIKSYLVASTSALTGIEIAWWVNEDHRKNKNGIKLLLFIEDLAKKQGIKYWNMVAMESCNPEVARQIYGKLGYKMTESTYTKEL